MEVKLVVLEGKNKDRQIPLPETIFMIGRDPQCHLRPHCQGVSKLHCAIAAWAGKVRVRDLKSRNGTFLNGQAIQGEVTVSDGDQLRVGTLVFQFQIKPEEEPLRPGGLANDDHNLEWLLNHVGDSGVFETGNETTVLPVAEAIDLEAAPGSKAVSAGQHLRAYLKQRMRRPAPKQVPGNGAGKKPGEPS